MLVAWYSRSIQTCSMYFVVANILVLVLAWSCPCAFVCRCRWEILPKQERWSPHVCTRVKSSKFPACQSFHGSSQKGLCELQPSSWLVCTSTRIRMSSVGGSVKPALETTSLLLFSVVEIFQLKCRMSTMQCSDGRCHFCKSTLSKVVCDTKLTFNVVSCSV